MFKISIIRAKVRFLLRPLKNRKAFGIFDVIFASIFLLIFFIFFFFRAANIAHREVQSTLHSHLESLVDLATENRELTSGMQDYCVKQLNGSKWYGKHFVLHIKIAEYQEASDSIVTVADYTVDCDSSVLNDIKLKRSQILTTTVESTGKNMLTAASNLMPHVGVIPDLAVTASASGIVR